MTDSGTPGEQGAPRMRRLADLRHLAGLTQLQVAEAMGVKQARVSQIELDYPRLTFPVLASYMRAIGGSVVLSAGGGAAVADDLRPDPERVDARRRRVERDHGTTGRFV